MAPVYCGRCGVRLAEHGKRFGLVVAHLQITNIDGDARLYGTRAHREVAQEGELIRRHSPTTVLAASSRTPVALRCSACGPLGSVSARTLVARWRADWSMTWEPSVTWPWSTC